MSTTNDDDLPKITPDQLEPGNVLLCKGADDDLFDRIIVFFAGGPYCHSAFWNGSKVVQASDRGVNQDDLSSLSEEDYVDVYKFHKDGHVLGDPDWPAQPLVDEANKLASEDHPYAWGHCILMAICCLTRKIDLPPMEKAFLRFFMDQAAGFIDKLIDGDKEPMMCSEVVYTIFEKAIPEHHYELCIEGVPFQHLQALCAGPVIQNSLQAVNETKLFSGNLLSAAEANEIDFSFANSEKRFFDAWMKAKGVDVDKAIETGNFDPVVAACVTPYDLSKSPNLERIGRLDF
jgi:hypothetical protein